MKDVVVKYILMAYIYLQFFPLPALSYTSAGVPGLLPETWMYLSTSDRSGKSSSAGRIDGYSNGEILLNLPFRSIARVLLSTLRVGKNYLGTAETIIARCHDAPGALRCANDK